MKNMRHYFYFLLFPIQDNWEELFKKCILQDFDEILQSLNLEERLPDKDEDQKHSWFNSYLIKKLRCHKLWNIS